MAHRAQMAMSAPMSALGGRPDEICSVCDLSVLTRKRHPSGATEALSYPALVDEIRRAAFVTLEPARWCKVGPPLAASFSSSPIGEACRTGLGKPNGRVIGSIPAIKESVWQRNRNDASGRNRMFGN
jgi:hypothetical protein